MTTPRSSASARSLCSLFSLALIFAGFLGGCQQASRVDLSMIDTTGGPVRGDWVIIHSLSDPENLNPYTSSDAGAQEIDAQIYEALLSRDPFTLEWIPWIADSLPIISEDRKTYEFTLNRNVKFSDGHPLTAEDFIFTLKVIKNQYIEQAAPSRGYYERVDSAVLVDGDPYRLRVTMREPYFLGIEFVAGVSIMPRHIWDPKNLSAKFSFAELNQGDTSNPAIDELATYFEDVEKARSKKFLVGSGPYRLSEWRRNDRVVLERNPNYWNSSHVLGKSWPDRLMWRSINDYNAALVSLRAHDLDVMPRMEKILYTRTRPILSKLGLRPAEYDYPAYNYIGYNCDKPLLADPAVRRALAHAINREAIIEKIYFGMARAVQSPIFYKRPEYDTTLPIIKYNLDSTRAILAANGWKDTDGDGTLDKVIDGKKIPFVFTIMLNQGNQARAQMAILFVNELRKVGIDASTTSLDWSTFLKNTREGNYDAYIGGWVMGVEEGDMYQIWHSKSAEQGGSNYVKFRNAEVDRLIEEMRGEFDVAKRREGFIKIQRIINDQQPYNFLVSEVSTGAYSARFQNAQFYPPRPCYNPAWWWVPNEAQRYSTPAGNTAVAFQ